MNRAQNCLEFREALRFWGTPSQNTVYADVQGNIGYTQAGRVPIRLKGDGRLADREDANIKKLLKKIGLPWEDKPKLQ
jgi:acyl-homoserine lactone acylase PvdQ